MVTQRKVDGTAVVWPKLSMVPAKPNLTVVGLVTMREPRVEVVAGGYGRSVGMSQRGAHGLALLGRIHQPILIHYYRGTKVENRS